MPVQGRDAPKLGSLPKTNSEITQLLIYRDEGTTTFQLPEDTIALDKSFPATTVFLGQPWERDKRRQFFLHFTSRDSRQTIKRETIHVGAPVRRSLHPAKRGKDALTR
ncbi:hypothetical protein AVEN_2886-1 [Araneus ventricosus]|uniref:Uncharacterized protein n=1 Tax=Araneus ventricosus TaxID=182803 RepID=A0A4Y2SBT4_ARAVE|nr:hypothetical protein AVEN_2886-1 [Araneus ventricosus]